MLRMHVVSAVFRRNVLSYFSGVLGYLFIVVFVVAAAFLAFSPQFFTKNAANLDQLTEWFPMLLLFIVPAITMNVWADERRQGTDELLFTMPATDVEILLGKYFAVLAVYTIALLFSAANVGVLMWIGQPDLGQVFATYFGYWIAGATLLAAGMVASSLTSSATVAFVLGVVICAVPVFIGHLSFGFIGVGLMVAGGLALLAGILRTVTLTSGDSRRGIWTIVLGVVLLLAGAGISLLPEALWQDVVASVGVPQQLQDFGLGLLPLTGILYFLSLTGFMLYLNLVLIARRHWSSSQQTSMGAQFAVRVVALVVALAGVNLLVSHASTTADLTGENLYSFSETTSRLLDDISSERPVTISAFISPEVPRDYVEVRTRLIGLLRQYGREAGSRVEVRIVDVEPFSEQAEEAEHYGISPRRVRSERDGRQITENVFMGAVVTSSYDEVVIPFIGPGTPVEYELTRSISTVSNAERATVGILTTDAQVLSGGGEWQIVTELKQQYHVKEVSADSPIPADEFDVLLAVLPSSLTAPQMENFVAHVQSGAPVLIFDDPFPLAMSRGSGVSLAPRQPKPSPGGAMGGMGGMFGGMNQQQGPPKASEGRATSLMQALDTAWNYDEIAWDAFNPHLEFGDIPPEYLFISPASGLSGAISTSSDITSGLQEVVAIYAGTIRPRAGSNLKFQPLLRTGTNSGLLAWDEFTQMSFDFASRSPAALPKSPDEILHVVDADAHVLAAHITGNDSRKLNVVYVADCDLISDWTFAQRQLNPELRFDNVTFVLNAVDVLAGDTRYLDLRKRRPEQRTLEEVEKRTASFKAERLAKEEEADKAAKQKLEDAEARFEKQRKEIEADETLDPRTREIMLANVSATERRRLKVDRANIDNEKKYQIDQIKAETEREIRETERRIMYMAVAIPPIPAVLLGIIVLLLRLYQERQNISRERLAPQ
ncbi:MAG: Gldg family protein [Planctomycetaceae bacterium]|nr:Gldg family protein [Planctomycetaceae bacterium]